MQPAALSLIVLLAPLPAAAFGDLNCITIEACGNEGCTPAANLNSSEGMVAFSITFNWPAQQALVTFDDETTTLSVVQRPETSVLEGDAPIMQTTAEFGNLESDAAFLRVEGRDSAQGSELIAFWAYKDPLTTTLVAQCDRLQAT